MPLMPVAEALVRVLADARALPAETVALDDALGRVLTENLNALRTQPPAAVSAMDGYAVRAADVAQAPVKLKLIGEVAAGHPFEGEVNAGQAARIFTAGITPPVKMRAAWPAFTSPSKGWPAATSPMSFSLTGACATSAEFTA